MRSAGSSASAASSEAAKILARRGFAVQGDYKYDRLSEKQLKTFSVDIEATAYHPFGDPNKIDADLYLLIECKQRQRQMSWLFLPEPSSPEFSPITMGCTLRSVEAFSEWYVPLGSTVNFDEDLPTAYKGIEIEESDGKVFDGELREGLSQLQFALPRLLGESIEFNLHQTPFFFCPILLTTAELFVAHGDFSINRVESCKTISDLADPVPFLVIYADGGPEFERHQRRVFGQLLDDINLFPLDEFRLSKGTKFHSPSKVLQDLAGGSRYEFLHLFSQLVVCNLNHFDSLLEKLAGSVNSAMNSAKSLKRMRTRRTGGA